MKHSNLLKQLNTIELEGYGCYSLDLGILNPDFGYMVSFQNHKEQHDYCNIDLLSDYAKRKAHYLYKPEYFLQVIKDNGYTFDLVEFVPDKETAMRYAQVKGTKVWDNQQNDFV